MRRLLAGGLGLSLSLGMGSLAIAQGPQRPIIPIVKTQKVGGETSAASFAVLGKPVEVGLGKPEPIAPDAAATKQPIRDNAVQPAGFREWLSSRPQPMIVTQAPQPLPLGPVMDAGPMQMPASMQTVQSNPQMLKMPQAAETKAPPLVTSSSPLPVTTAEPVGSTWYGASPIVAGECPVEGACGNKWWNWDCQPDHTRWWIGAEYLLWFVKDSNYPPLVTAGSSLDPNSAILGRGGVTLFGGGPINYEELSGFRVSGGYWFDEEQTWGLDGNIFFLGQRGQRFQAGSIGFPLARPFIDETGTPAVQFVGNFNQGLSGHVDVDTKTRVWGGDINLRDNLWKDCCWRIDWLTGFRFFSLQESLNVTEDLFDSSGMRAGTATPVPAGIVVQDRFFTKNDFYGGQIGLDLGLRKGPWTLNLLGKVGLGDMHQMASIAGETIITPIPATGLPARTLQGGLLAQPSNIGHYTRDQFAFVPEAGVKLGYQLTENVRLTVGYTFLYASDVVRPGTIIDPNINRSQIPGYLPRTVSGPLVPQFAFRSTDFWVQGVNFGLEFRF